MKLFFSWSGEISNEFAKRVRDWIDPVLGKKDLEIFISTEDIKVGEKWKNSLESILNEAGLGILFLTSENVNSPWIGFEAGWLAQRLDDQTIIPFYLDISPEMVEGPLAWFQGIEANEKGMLDLMLKINELVESKEDESIIATRVSAMFPRLEKELDDLILLGKSGVTINYELVPDDLDLSKVYDVYSSIIAKARTSINVLTSGEIELRIRNEANVPKHIAYTNRLAEILESKPELTYRELIGANLYNNHRDISSWVHHIEKIMSFRNRSNINFRSTNDFFRFESMVIVDNRYAVLERSESFNSNERRIVGIMNIKDTTEAFPNMLLREFNLYWDRNSQSINY